MALRVYNTLSHEKEDFQPVHPGKVGIYLCGPTVYKESHIGHAVGPVIFDAIKRYLVHRGYEVTWVVNITDVEDKIIVEAAKEGCDVFELAERIAASYIKSLEELGVQGIDHMPKASEHIGDIIEMVEGLIRKDIAYASNGDVYFDVTRFEEYGKLSNRKIEDQSGQRDLVSQEKRNPNDFALWKSAKPGEPPEVSFDSPWGRGRPGWHIECSVMSMKFLGDTLDFHGGGMDLIFPHHENEIAQSEAYSGKPFANHWMHNGLTRLNTKKLSKSDPEMQAAMAKMTLSHLLERYTGELMRYFILSTHYRRPIEFSDEEIASKQKGLESFYRLFERVQRISGQSAYGDAAALKEGDAEKCADEYRVLARQVIEQQTQFIDSMEDDFNTAGAIGALFKMAGSINRFVDDQQLESSTDEAAKSVCLSAARALVEHGRILGLFVKPLKTDDSASDAITPKLVELFIRLRADAKKEKNFSLADKIRDELAGLGVTLEDRPDGTDWRLQ